jgi:hypothetical protein
MKCEDERLNPTPNATRMANLKLLSQTKSFWKVLRENAITTTRLAQSQARRKKLGWLDLRTADYRIGKKAYADGNTLADHAELVSRLFNTQISLEALRKSNDLTPTTFAEKAKAALLVGATPSLDHRDSANLGLGLDWNRNVHRFVKSKGNPASPSNDCSSKARNGIPFREGRAGGAGKSQVDG